MRTAIRVTTLAALVSACSSAHHAASPVREPPELSARDAAPSSSTSPPDAAAAVVIAPPDTPAPPPLPDPPFVPPAALAPPAAATPASRTCRSTPDEDADHEAARVAAATDVALRKLRYIPLTVSDSMLTNRNGRLDPGAHPIRARDGGYWLVVGSIEGCGGEAPTVAMTASHEVFVVNATLAPASLRSVLECTNTCRGVCGTEMPPHDALAAVPADAVLGAPKEIRVPIAVAVSFRTAQHMDCNVP